MNGPLQTLNLETDGNNWWTSSSKVQKIYLHAILNRDLHMKYNP
jgi:hypothetical protein